MMINIGSVIGDICGSIYEFKAPANYEDIRLFESGCRFTDDTVMSCAVADWLVNNPEHTRETLVEKFKEYGRKYPCAGYGGKFHNWLMSEDTEDYGSFGNGSGMRVGPVGFYTKSLDECLELAKITAETTHGHVEGIKGAQAIASCIYLAREGKTKEAIKKYIEETFGYDLNKKLEELGYKQHRFDCTCQITVPEAIICFLESENFEDCIKKSISIGGDTDTIACMSGGIAEAFYGIPAYLKEKAKNKLPKDLSEPFRMLTFSL